MFVWQLISASMWRWVLTSTVSTQQRNGCFCTDLSSCHGSNQNKKELHPWDIPEALWAQQHLMSPLSFVLLFILFSLQFFTLIVLPLSSSPSFPLFSQPISLFSSQRETRVLFSEAREKLRLTYESHWEEISNFRQFFSLLFSLLFFMVSN